jgi:hypothetical protein
MNINVNIIDQQIRGLAAKLKPEIEQLLDKTLDETMTRSIAFVLLCAKVMLNLTDEESIESLTEGGNDFGVDALVVSDVLDGEFTVTLIQGKYNHQNLEGTKGIPEDAVRKAVQAVRALFDPSSAISVNRRLEMRIEEIRSLIVDGNIPNVRFLLCSNGQPWKRPEAQDIIDREKFPDRVRFEHVNHDVLIQIMGSTKPVNDNLQFAGKAIIEDLNFARVFIGKVPVAELARLMEAHGDRLLERNIRRYLGRHGNRVNEGIYATLRNPAERENFYFYNNGVTLICDRFDYNALQPENNKVRLEGLQIVNGGQTSKTIQSALGTLGSAGLEQVHVLVRLYQVSKDSEAFTQTITYATNSQNPVDLKDLRSNDELQLKLETGVKALGFEYRRKRSEAAPRSVEISNATAAEAVLAVWREKPQQAKFRSGEHFGKLYASIFKDLDAAQLVTAVLLFRIAENKRKRPPAGAPDYVSYASCFAAMLMGRYLLKDLEIPLNKLDHRKFAEAQSLIQTKGDSYFDQAIVAIGEALQNLYGSSPKSLQQLSATFRRGDLIQYLTNSPWLPLQPAKSTVAP